MILRFLFLRTNFEGKFRRTTGSDKINTQIVCQRVNKARQTVPFDVTTFLHPP